MPTSGLVSTPPKSEITALIKRPPAARRGSSPRRRRRRRGPPSATRTRPRSPAAPRATSVVPASGGAGERGAGSPRPGSHSSSPALRWRPSPSYTVEMRASCTRSSLAARHQPSHHVLLAVADRAARPPRQCQHGVLLVEERREPAERVELLPARRLQGLGGRAEAVHLGAAHLARHATHASAGAAQVEWIAHRRERQLEAVAEGGLPAVAVPAHLGPCRAAPAACRARTAASRPSARCRAARGPGRRRQGRRQVRSPLEARRRSVVLRGGAVDVVVLAGRPRAAKP